MPSDDYVLPTAQVTSSNTTHTIQSCTWNITLLARSRQARALCNVFRASSSVAVAKYPIVATTFSAAPNTRCGTHEPVRLCSITPMNGTITPKAFARTFPTAPIIAASSPWTSILLAHAPESAQAQHSTRTSIIISEYCTTQYECCTQDW